MWALGALLAIFGSVATNFGVNVQKHSQNLNSKLPKLQQQFYYKQKLYLIGLVLVILGSLGDFAALSMAAQSIVAPLGSVTLVTNIFFAKYFLHESLGRKDLFGTIGIIIGSVVAVAFGDHADVTYTVNQLLSFYSRGQFIAFAVITALAATIGYIFVRTVNPLKTRLNDSFKRYDYLIDVQDKQISNTITDELSHEPIITDDDIDYQQSIIECLELDYKRYEKLHPFVLCALSGVLGGWSVMFGKMVAECLSTTFAGHSQLGNPPLYLFALCMLCTIMGQLNFLAVALGFFDALYCVPIFQCFWIMTSTFGGACYFNEFARFSTVQWIFFPIGIIITITGVVVLSTRDMTQRTSDNNVKHGDTTNKIPAINELEVLDEVDEISDNDDITSDEDKLKLKLQRIQYNAQVAAEALDNNNDVFIQQQRINNDVIELTDVNVRVQQYNNDMKHKIEQLQQQQHTPKSSSPKSNAIEESKEQPPSIIPSQTSTSPIRKLNDNSDYSPNTRARLVQQQQQQQHRRRSSSNSPNYRRSIELDYNNAPDTPLHRAISYFAGTYSAAVGAVHASDYIHNNNTIDTNDTIQLSNDNNSKPVTPTHTRVKSIDNDSIA